MPTAAQLLKQLKPLGTKKNREGMARFGINTTDAFGVPVPKIRALAKQIGPDHRLAQELWKTGNHEARLLACFIDDPAKVTEAQMGRWAKCFDSWDVCDQCCGCLFGKAPFAYKKVREWARRDEEFVRRAAFALLASLAVHDKKAGDKKFEQFFPLIKKYSTDERNYVKKAVNWALRQIGKRNKALNKKAVAAAKEIKKIDSRSARWIAADAIRELTSEKVRRRLN
ncbi:MAG: DNA alkylation repair protein [Candidatus Diapherotrites archaeon]|nr:DNA alkylation repair protein [Candidatus Diapherotrites archaeon]